MPTKAKATKAAAAAPKQQDPEEARKIQVADEYGRLMTELAPMKEKLKRTEELARVLRSFAGAEAAERPVTIQGREYEVILSSCENRTLIAPNDKLYKKLGRDEFLRVANVTLGALQRWIHPATVAELTEQKQIGPRSIMYRPRL